MDGNPGPNYWQNRVNYKLKAELNPENGLLLGSGTIKFINNSPDKLDRLIFRLYSNIFKKGAVRDFLLAPSDIHDGVEIKKLIVNDEEIDAKPFGGKVGYTSTNMIVYLANEIDAGAVTEIEIEWEFTLSRISNVRMGRYTGDDIFVGYWFPQIAVYDDIDGWDINEYSGKTEFYNEFGDYEVEIIVPGGYMVWATGLLQNGEEIFNPKINDRLNQAVNSDAVIHIVTANDHETEQVFLNDNQTTWKFKAEYVSDFSFALSKDYLWDAVGVNTGNEKHPRIIAHAVYPQDSKKFNLVGEYSKIAIEYLSSELPGVPFPFPQMTTFCNQRSGGGMEFPMMANDGDPADSVKTFALTFHEISHAYFPFYMGTNERKYSWMDEGWARFFTAGPSLEFVGDESYYSRVLAEGITIFGNEADMPIITPSYLVKGSTALAIWYSKPFFAYAALQNLLGEILFKSALQEFMKRWHGKHPMPYDFFFTFDDVAGQDLSWFWKPWFFENGVADIGIKNVNQYKGKIIIEVEKVGNLPVPIQLQVGLDDGSFIELSRDITIWKDGKHTVIFEVETDRKFKFVNLINDKIPDINPENDHFAVGIM